MTEYPGCQDCLRAYQRADRKKWDLFAVMCVVACITFIAGLFCGSVIKGAHIEKAQGIYIQKGEHESGKEDHSG